MPEALSEKARKYYKLVWDIVHDDVIPLEPELMKYYSSEDRWKTNPKLEQIKVSIF